MNDTNYEVLHCGAVSTPHSHPSWAQIFNNINNVTGTFSDHKTEILIKRIQSLDLRLHFSSYIQLEQNMMLHYNCLSSIPSSLVKNLCYQNLNTITEELDLLFFYYKEQIHKFSYFSASRGEQFFILLPSFCGDSFRPYFFLATFDTGTPTSWISKWGKEPTCFWMQEISVADIVERTLNFNVLTGDRIAGLLVFLHFSLEISASSFMFLLS